MNFSISKEFNWFHRENDKISTENGSLEFKRIKWYNSQDLLGLINPHRCWWRKMETNYVGGNFQILSTKFWKCRQHRPRLIFGVIPTQIVTDFRIFENLSSQKQFEMIFGLHFYILRWSVLISNLNRLQRGWRKVLRLKI